MKTLIRIIKGIGFLTKKLFYLLEGEKREKKQEHAHLRVLV